MVISGSRSQPYNYHLLTSYAKTINIRPESSYQQHNVMGLS